MALFQHWLCKANLGLCVFLAMAATFLGNEGTYTSSSSNTCWDTQNYNYCSLVICFHFIFPYLDLLLPLPLAVVRQPPPTQITTSQQAVLFLLPRCVWGEKRLGQLLAHMWAFLLYFRKIVTFGWLVNVEYYMNKIFKSSIYVQTGKGGVTKQHSLRRLSLAFLSYFGNRSFLALWNSVF